MRDAAEGMRSEFTGVLRDTSENKADPDGYADVEVARRERRASALFTPAFELRERTGGARVLVADYGFTSRTGESPAYLVIDSLLGAKGDNPGTFVSPLFSDVQTLVATTVNGVEVRTPVVYNDLGQVRMRAVLKNPNSPTGPSSVNAITVTRYHVEYRRSDGRNR